MILPELLHVNIIEEKSTIKRHIWKPNNYKDNKIYCHFFHGLRKLVLTYDSIRYNLNYYVLIQFGKKVYLKYMSKLNHDWLLPKVRVSNLLCYLIHSWEGEMDWCFFLGYFMRKWTQQTSQEFKLDSPISLNNHSITRTSISLNKRCFINHGLDMAQGWKCGALCEDRTPYS